MANAVPDTTDYSYSEFMSKARLATFICTARSFNIDFTMDDLKFIAGDVFAGYLFDKYPFNEILDDSEVKNLITTNTAYNKFIDNGNYQQIQSQFHQPQDVIMEDAPTLDHGQNATKNKDKDLSDISYNKEINLQGNSIDDIVNNLIKDANEGFKDKGVKEDNFNSFIYELATQGQINKSTLKNTTKEDIIKQLKDSGEIEQIYDKNGDSFSNKVKLATFLCVARNLNIEFNREDLNNLFDNDDFYNRYPANVMLKNEEIKRLITDKNEISQTTNYQDYNNYEVKNSNNENKVDLENVGNVEKHKLSVALAEYFSCTNIQDKANAIKDLSTDHRKKIVDFDQFMNGKFENNPEEAKRVVLYFLDLCGELSSSDKDLKVELSMLKDKINRIKEPSMIMRALRSIKEFLWKPFAWLLAGSNKNPPSVVFTEKNKNAAKNMIKRLNAELDKVIDKEKQKDSREGSKRPERAENSL